MFVPEVEVKRWSDFAKILPQGEVYVYYWGGYGVSKLNLQVFDGLCVYTHHEPEWRLGIGYYLGGRKVNEKPLKEKLKEIQDLHERDVIMHQWWDRRLKRFVRRLAKQYPFVEGRIATIAFAATEE